VMENKLMESVLIGQVMIVGENKKFPAALIVPAFEELEKYCKVKGIPFDSRESIIQNPQILEKYQQEIDKANENFGHWEMVKKFVLLSKEWTIDNGELTPKLSLKRKIILQKHMLNKKEQAITKEKEPFIQKIKGFGKLLIDSGNGFAEDNCMKLSASLAYYTVFSIGPLIIILIWALGFFYGSQLEGPDGAQHKVITELNEIFGAEITL
jgi:hypothetical protein